VESWLLGDEYTGQSIMHTGDSMNIRLISKSFLGMSIWTRRSYSMKKIPEEKTL
jgi:hypothetical protein